MVQAEVLGRLRLTPRDEPLTPASHSGANVVAVHTHNGADAVLKVVQKKDGERLWRAAQWELRFYRDLAPTLPGHAPRVLDHLREDDRIALVLADAGYSPAPDAGAAMWQSLGRSVAQIHLTRVADRQRWLRPDPLLEAIQFPDLAQLERFWAGHLPSWDRIVAAGESLVPRRDRVFIHGDLHLGNVLVADEVSAPVICDWQVSGIGRDTTDLAMVNARLAPQGVTAPEGFVSAYREVRPVAEEALVRDVAREEFLLLFFQCPAFEAMNSEVGVERIKQRAVRLAEVLQLA